MRNCIFRGNRGGEGGAIYYGGRGHPLIENCVITDNHADAIGGGIFLVNSPGEQGSAVDAPMLRGCTITGNTAPDGGGIFAIDIVLHLEDCLVAGSQASNRGGGILVAGYGIPEQPQVGVDLLRCTIAGNQAPEGSGLRLATAVLGPNVTRPRNLTMTGCIVHGNRGGAQVEMSAANLLSVGCSVIDGDGPGNEWPAGYADAGGNLATDPRFCDPQGGDYHLHADSPAHRASTRPATTAARSAPGPWAAARTAEAASAAGASCARLAARRRARGRDRCRWRRCGRCRPGHPR